MLTNYDLQQQAEERRQAVRNTHSIIVGTRVNHRSLRFLVGTVVQLAHGGVADQVLVQWNDGFEDYAQPELLANLRRTPVQL